MIKRKIRSFIAVIISIAMFCSLLPVHPATVYAAGDGEDLGKPVTMKLYLPDEDDSGYPSVFVWRQESSTAPMEEIGYYSPADGDPYGTITFTLGDILTFYVYDPPQTLVFRDTLYYVNSYYEDFVFSRGRDPMGNNDCYSFTLDTSSISYDLYRSVSIFYNYDQVEYYRHRMINDLQYCLLTDESMSPVYFGPGEDGSYITLNSSNMSAYVSSFNGWNKFITYNMYKEVAYAADRAREITGFLIDGNEYSCDYLESVGYMSRNNEYFVFDLSVLMPAMAANEKEDERTVTIRPLFSETQSVYGEFLLDFHRGAAEDTYVDVIQSTPAGTDSSYVTFSSRDWNEEGKCVVPYRVGEKIRMVLGNIPEKYQDEETIRAVLLSEDGNTYDFLFTDNNDGTYILDTEYDLLENYLDETECPTFFICYDTDHLVDCLMDQYRDFFGEHAYILDISKNFTRQNPDTEKTPIMADLEETCRFLVNTDASDRLRNISLKVNNPSYVDHFVLDVYGEDVFTGEAYSESISIPKTTGWLGFNSSTGLLTYDSEYIEYLYSEYGSGNRHSYYNCSFDVVYSSSFYKRQLTIQFDVNGGEIYRSLPSGSREGKGNETLVYECSPSQIFSNMTLGDLITESGKYMDRLRVESQEYAYSEGWTFRKELQNTDSSDQSQWYWYDDYSAVFSFEELKDLKLSYLLDRYSYRDRNNARLMRINLENVWHTEGPVQVNFVTSGRSFRLIGKNGAPDLITSDDSRLQFSLQSSGISIFNQQYMNYSAIEPVRPEGFLGWQLSRASGGSKITYTPLTPDLYSCEEVKAFLPDASTYGNSICFVAKWDDSTKVQGVSATIDEMIALNFYLTLNMHAETLILDGPEGEKTLDVSELELVEDSLYKVSYDVPAACMNYSVSLKVIDDFGEQMELLNENADSDGTFYYSVRQYLKEAINTDQLLEEKLVEALYFYGIYAEDYFGLEHVEALPEIPQLVNENIERNLEKAGPSISGSLPAGVDYYGSSLILLNGIRMRHYFTANPGTVTIGGQTVRPASIGSLWYVETPKIPAVSLEATAPYSVKLSSWTMNYSVEMFCLKAIAEHNAMEELARSLYYYLMIARQFPDLCEHEDSAYVYSGSGYHVSYCTNCGEILSQNMPCERYRSNGICSLCGSAEQSAHLGAMVITSKTPQGRELEKSDSASVYDGDIVTISNEWTYSDNPSVTDWEAHLYASLPDGKTFDLMEEYEDISVDVLERSVTRVSGTSRGKASVSFYATDELSGAKFRFEVNGCRKTYIGSAGTETELLETYSSVERTLTVKDALSMGFRKNLDPSLQLLAGESGVTLSVRAYGPGTLHYQWQVLDDSEETDEETGEPIEVWKNISYANSSTYSLGQFRESVIGKMYRCLVTNDESSMYSESCMLMRHDMIYPGKMASVLDLTNGNNTFGMNAMNGSFAVESLELANGTLYGEHEAQGLILKTFEGVDENSLSGLTYASFRLSEEAQKMDLKGATIRISLSGRFCKLEGYPCKGEHIYIVRII